MSEQNLVSRQPLQPESRGRAAIEGGGEPLHQVADDRRIAAVRVESGTIAGDELERLKAQDPEVKRLLARRKGGADARFCSDGKLRAVSDGTPAGEFRASASLLNTFGTASPEFMAASLNSLEVATRHRGDERQEQGQQITAAIALVRGIDPQNELEGALAVQMAATHTLSMEMLCKARHADDHDRLNAYVTNAAKLSRTFTAQMEALGRLRGAGRQTVEVTHTHIDARGSQNVIGDVSARGDGGANGNLARPHAPAALSDAALAVGLPLRSQDEERDALQVAGGAREEAMPDARRRQPRRAKGTR